ncbi:hypothetical protein ACWDUN_03770 [Mycobacterium sp. NPDC003323]
MRGVSLFKRFSGASLVFLGYLCCLLGFAVLGLFVAALATQSPLAWLGGPGVVIAFGAAIAGLRSGARAGGPWSESKSSDAERYRARYRRVEQSADESGEHRAEAA